MSLLLLPHALHQCLLPSSSSTLLLLDNIHCHSTFLTLTLLSDALRQLRPVILLNSNQSYWHSLLQKHGIRTHSNQYNHLFTAIDSLPHHQPLHQLIRSLVADQKTPPLLIIDHLNSFVWAGDRSSEQLIQQFHSLLPCELELDFSLVLIFHDDLIQSNQRDREVFNHLVNRSDIILRTRALAGQGEGELTIQRGPGYLNNLNLPVTTSIHQTTQFKIIDNSVSFHPKGLNKNFI